MDVLAYLHDLEVKIGSHFDRVAKAVKESRIESCPFRLPAQGKTDANGNCEIPVMGSQPSNKSLVVGRVIVIADGFTPTNPFVGAVGAAGCWYGLFHGKGQNLGTMDDFQPYNNQALLLPSVASYSGHNAPVFQRSDDLYFGMTKGPVSTNITVIVCGWMTDYGKENI